MCLIFTYFSCSSSSQSKSTRNSYILNPCNFEKQSGFNSKKSVGVVEQQEYEESMFEVEVATRKIN